MSSMGEEDLVAYLGDAYVLERIGLCLLLKGTEHRRREVTSFYRDQSDYTRDHSQIIAERLEQFGRARPGEQSHIHVGALRIDFHRDAPQSAADLAISIYTVWNLQITLYHLLGALARHYHDEPTQELADRILEQKEDATELFASVMVEEMAA